MSKTREQARAITGKKRLSKADGVIYEKYKNDRHHKFVNNNGNLGVDIIVSKRFQSAIDKRVARYEAALSYLNPEALIRIGVMKTILLGLIDLHSSHDHFKIHNKINFNAEIADMWNKGNLK